MAELDARALPLADEALTNQVRPDRARFYAPILFLTLSVQILDLVQQASSYKQLKKGANEGTMHLSR